MLITGSKGVTKRLFSDIPTAATETSPVTMQKCTEKPVGIHYYTETQINGFPLMLVGYMRVSSESDRQITDLQRDALLAVGVDGRHLFEDHASGAKDDRPGLTQALSFVRPGDVLVVWKLDRLGRSLSHLLCIVKYAKGEAGRLPLAHRRHGYHDGVGRVTISCIRCACQV